MNKKKWLSLLLAVMTVFTLLPAAAFAQDEASRTIDFATFLQEVAASNYQYDGEGVTVKWSPSSACTVSGNHKCLFEGEAPAADGNNPQRGQEPNAQYQIFAGQADVKIENVHFQFVPEDFTICVGNAWGGSFTKDAYRNAELQLLNTGAVSFHQCTFDGVIVSPFSSTTSTSITNCDFSNVYDAYAIKDIHSPNVLISQCTFTHCGGGIYLEGDSVKGTITIQDNDFSDMDTYAVENKKLTRGLIQFSAKGDYQDAVITISGNTSTGDAATVRQLNKTITEDVLDLAEMDQQNSFSGNVLTDSTYGSNTVYYNGTCYPTLVDALTGVYTSSPTQTAKLYCKPNSDVGTMTHGHVADDLIIYGNGATVSGGEGDLEIDTYRYDRTTGKQSKDGAFLGKDISVQVWDLNGIAAWGQRNTDHTINLSFYNCKNMDRIYFTNTANEDGLINITLEDCSFDSNNGSNPNTAVYSNAAGDIQIRNTDFTDIAVGLNINHKSSGVQNILLEGCTFTDCALSDSSQAATTKTYGAPVRIVARDGATTNLTVKDVSFQYSEGKVNCGNGDILIGDGRYDAAEKQGITTLSMSGTQAVVMVQEKGYYTTSDGSTTDTTKTQTTQVAATDVVFADENNHFTVDQHTSTKLVGAKDATCTEEGYTGDLVCTQCGMVIQSGTVIEKLPHTYENGVCTVCGAKDPNYQPEDGTSPDTGDSSNLVLFAGLLLISGAGLGSILLRKKKTSAK